jgi:DnaJ-class molecular chaperone
MARGRKEASKDYYELLGVPRTATEKEIKKAYRQLALKYHPDAYKGDDKEEASRKFNEFTNAYDVCVDLYL